MEGGGRCLNTVGRKASVRARKHGPEGQKSRDGAPRGVCIQPGCTPRPKRGTVVRRAALHPLGTNRREEKRRRPRATNNRGDVACPGANRASPARAALAV